jgi:aspartyl-tRNA(Asn)/glutamyl-tRNA(Gln) amidotransferase subunit C
MKIDDQMIDKISRLAYLEFGEDEKEKIRQDIEQILTFVEQLKELDTENVEPLVYLSDKTDVLREDRMIPTITAE